MFPLFETIKILNGNVSNLTYHQKRFEYSFETYFGKPPSLHLKEIIKIPKDFTKGLVKLRLLYNQENFDLEFSHYQQRKIITLQQVVADNVEYSLKFTNRSTINEIYNRRENCDDVLIIRNGFVTDSSIANIMFFDGKKWITPSTPLLHGTCREKLLFEKKLAEEKLKTDDLLRFTHFALINAMLCDNIIPLPVANIHK